MSALAILALSAAGDGGARAWLFALVVLAVILILAGCVIAVLTLYYQRKATPPDRGRE